MARVAGPRSISPFANRRRSGSPSSWQLARFSALAVPLYAAAQPVLAYVPAILSRNYGIPLARLGLVFLIGQIINSVLDPLVGTWSDRTVSRFGRRRPWVAGGGVLFMIGSAMLFFPPPHVSIAWVALAAIVYFAGSSITQTALLAWSGEISGDYDQRTRIASHFSFMAAAALVLALLLPAVADHLRPNDGPLRLTLFGTLVLATGLPGLWLTLTAMTGRADLLPMGGARPSAATALKAVFANRLLLRVLAADTVVTAGQGIRTVLMLFIVTIWFHRPEWAAGMFLFQYGFGLLAAPIWQRIGFALGKVRAGILGELVQMAINLGLVLLTPDRFGLMLVLAAAQGLSQGSGNLMLRAMVADLADVHALETGEERTGLYYSAFSISMKLGGAIAMGLALPLLGWIGFHAQGPNTPQALAGLHLLFALGPALAHGLAAALLAGFPLDQRSHSEIRARLEARESAFVPAE